MLILHLIQCLKILWKTCANGDIATRIRRRRVSIVIDSAYPDGCGFEDGFNNILLQLWPANWDEFKNRIIIPVLESMRGELLNEHCRNALYSRVGVDTKLSQLIDLVFGISGVKDPNAKHQLKS